MAEIKLNTIKLQGKDYCQVKDRVKAFNEQYKKGAIQTECNFNNDIVIFKCTVYPNAIDESNRFFTASSFGIVKGVKAFEKLETVAVGRALAFLGFGIDGSVASQEEIEEFEKQENYLKITAKQYLKISELTLFYSEEKKSNVAEIMQNLLSYFKISNLEDLSYKEADAAIKFLEKKIKEGKITDRAA